MRVLDLFSGIGGFSLGLERAGMKTVAFCEIDPFCKKVLKKHWPDVPIYKDIKNVKWKENQAEVITAGFPCQDISFAGKGAGFAGERSGLFWQAMRAVRLVRPQIVLLENVAALLTRGMGTVLIALAKRGYNAEWDCIQAAAVALPHGRNRVWIAAYTHGSSLEGMDIQKSFIADPKESRRRKLARAIDACISADDYTRERGNYNGVSEIMDRIKSLGNSIVPPIPEIIGNCIMKMLIDVHEKNGEKIVTQSMKEGEEGK